MGQDPDAIRREVEATRERMGDTIDALGHKADVKSRTKESISGKVDTVKERMGMATDKVSEAKPDSGQVKQQARRAAGIAQENPLGLAIGAAAVGFLAGLLIPSSRIEDEKIGPMADQVKEQVKQTGQEAVEHGKQAAQQTMEQGKQAAQQAVEHGKQAAQEAVEQSKQTAQDAAQNVRESAPSDPVSR